MREKLWKWPLRFAGLLMFCMIACGIICTAEAEAACSHDYQWKVTDPPTCTAGGKEKKICTKCGQVYDVHNLPIDKNNHSYTSSVTKKATCSSTGVRTYKCSRCSKTYTETIAKTSHSYSWVTDVQATCGKAGHENKKCKNCGYIADGRSIPYTNNHTWKLTSTVNATCTKDGSKTYKCSVCGQTKTEKYGTALGHSCSWTTEKKATCYAAGTEAFKCTRSGCSYVERRRDIPYTSHSWSLISTVEPTCTSAGSKKYKCSNSGCTATKTESYGSATGHSYTWTTDVQPSCNRTGHEKKYCTKCGYVADGNTLPYSSHRWVLSYTTGATCTKNGSRTYKCSVCGSTKTEEDKNDPATGHNYEWRVDTYPTCNKGGHDSKVCTKCGNVIDGRDTPSNHTWKFVETVEPTCTADGYELYKCSVCGQTRKDKYKDAIGHNYNIEKATCTENKTCKNCGFVAEYAGHELYHEHVAPTCAKNGYDVEKCRNCDFEQGGTTIEKLPHTPDRTNACEEEIKCITCGGGLQEKGHILETKGYYPVCANWHKETYCIACQKTIGVETIQNPDIQPHVLEEEILEQNADCNFKVRKYCTNKDCDYEVIVYEKRHDYYEPNLDDLSSWREDPYMTKYGFELPSCVGPGHYYQVCKNCGDVNPEAVSIPPTGHVRALHPATCTEYGYYFGPCLKCGYDKLPEKEIEYSAEPTGHVRALHPATCTEYGYYYGSCLNCGYDKLPEKEIEYSAEPTGHNFVPKKMSTLDILYNSKLIKPFYYDEPTATSPGLIHEICTKCNSERETKDIEYDNNQGIYYNEWKNQGIYDTGGDLFRIINTSRNMDYKELVIYFDEYETVYFKDILDEFINQVEYEIDNTPKKILTPENIISILKKINGLAGKIPKAKVKVATKAIGAILNTITACMDIYDYQNSNIDFILDVLKPMRNELSNLGVVISIPNPEDKLVNKKATSGIRLTLLIGKDVFTTETQIYNPETKKMDKETHVTSSYVGFGPLPSRNGIEEVLGIKPEIKKHFKIEKTGLDGTYKYYYPYGGSFTQMPEVQNDMSIDTLFESFKGNFYLFK